MPERREVDSHCLGQALDAVLGHAVDGAVLPADVAHLGGDVDDRPASPGGRHLPRHGLSNEVGGALVQAGDRVVIVLGHVQEGARAVGAGVVDQDVERVGGIDGGADGGKVGDVQDQRGGLAAGFADLAGGLGNLDDSAGHKGDVGANLGQCGGSGQTDTAAGASDQGAAAVQAHGG